MKKLLSIIISIVLILSLVSCEGMAISNKRYEEISNYVLENIETLSSEKEIEFFDYETTGLSIGGVYYGYYWTVNNMGYAGQSYYNDDIYYGVRPVIEVPKWMFGESFEFTIDGVTYEAKEGMTWGDWVNSSYDTRGFVNNYDLIYTDDLMYALVYQVDYGTFVSHSWPYIDDLIDPNLVYVTFYEAGEDGEW